MQPFLLRMETNLVHVKSDVGLNTHVLFCDIWCFDLWFDLGPVIVKSSETTEPMKLKHYMLVPTNDDIRICSWGSKQEFEASSWALPNLSSVQCCFSMLHSRCSPASCGNTCQNTWHESIDLWPTWCVGAWQDVRQLLLCSRWMSWGQDL